MISRVRLGGAGATMLAMGLVATLGGCASAITGREDMLAAAGFQVKPADTPEREASLRALPPHKFVMQSRDGVPFWVYADPTICNCLYRGDQAAYAVYKREVFEKQIADENLMSAQMNQQSPGYWDMWGSYGP